MSIEGDDILHTHVYQFLKCSCAVKRFSACTDILTAFVQIWHDDVYSAGLAADCTDYTFQVLKMVIRGHQICVLSDIVSEAVITYIYHQIDIVSTYRFHDRTFRFTGAETGCLNRNEVRTSLIALECEGVKFFVTALFTPLHQPVVNLFSQLTAADQRDQTESAHRKCS